MQPSICLCNFHPAPHHRQALQAFRAGLRRHGIEPIEREFPPDNCDLAVFWSHNPKHIIEHQRTSRNDYLVMERGYIGDRMQWTSLGFNGLNGRAQFHADGMPGDRWSKYFNGWLKPWKESGNYILLCGQVRGDASVRHIDIHRWLKNMEHLCRATYPEARVRYRPHPIEVQRKSYKTLKGVELSTRSLEEDLAEAAVCITYSSNVGVDAVLAGVPVIAVDPGSMVYHLASYNINEPPVRPNRTQWAHNMAYCQWTFDEIANGDAWEHLKRRYQ